MASATNYCAERLKLTESRVKEFNTTFMPWLSTTVHEYSEDYKSQLKEERCKHEVFPTQDCLDACFLEDQQLVLHKIQTSEVGIQSALRQSETTRNKTSCLIDRLKKEEADLDVKEKINEAELNDPNKSIELFRKWLSVDLKKVSDNGLEIRFTNILPDDPHHSFTLSLLTDEQRHYIVSDREGADKEFDAMVRELNVTNDLRSFIIAARRRYIKLYAPFTSIDPGGDHVSNNQNVNP